MLTNLQKRRRNQTFLFYVLLYTCVKLIGKITGALLLNRQNRKLERSLFRCFMRFFSQFLRVGKSEGWTEPLPRRCRKARNCNNFFTNFSGSEITKSGSLLSRVLIQRICKEKKSRQNIISPRHYDYIFRLCYDSVLYCTPDRECSFTLVDPWHK